MDGKQSTSGVDYRWSFGGSGSRVSGSIGRSLAAVHNSRQLPGRDPHADAENVRSTADRFIAHLR